MGEVSGALKYVQSYLNLIIHSEMKYKYLMYLLLAVLLGACSDDEPETPVSEYPSKSELLEMLEGKTWQMKECAYFDSEGNEFLYSSLIPGTGTTVGLLFSASDCRVAYSGVVGWPSRRGTCSWNYDEQKGIIFFPPVSDSSDEWYIESVSEDELIVRSWYGILPVGYFNYYHSLDLLPNYGEEMDEGSYERVVYRPVAVDAEAAFWEKYPERNK